VFPVVQAATSGKTIIKPESQSAHQMERDIGAGACSGDASGIQRYLGLEQSDSETLSVALWKTLWKCGVQIIHSRQNIT
jgi:hypothetical protein